MSIVSFHHLFDHPFQDFAVRWTSDRPFRRYRNFGRPHAHSMGRHNTPGNVQVARFISKRRVWRSIWVYISYLWLKASEDAAVDFHEFFPRPIKYKRHHGRNKTYCREVQKYLVHLNPKTTYYRRLWFEPYSGENWSANQMRIVQKAHNGISGHLKMRSHEKTRHAFKSTSFSSETRSARWRWFSPGVSSLCRHHTICKNHGFSHDRVLNFVFLCSFAQV